MPNAVYEGQVSVYDKKADGSQLVIGKGDRKGEPYYKISFKVDDQWVNLMDFEGITGGVAGVYTVEYYQKFAPNGEPDLYNGKPQYQLVSLVPAGGAQAPRSGAPVAQATQGSPMPQKAPYDPDLGARQTAANDAVHAANAEATINKKFDMTRWLDTFDVAYQHIHGKLTGKNELDVALDTAKQAGFTQMPDESKHVDEPTELGDSDIPFLSV